MKRQRPLLSLEAARTFYAIADYVRRYQRSYRARPRELPEAASDVLDGWKRPTDPEIRELIRRGILRAFRCEAAWPGGPRSSWDLTERGCDLVRKRAAP